MDLQINYMSRTFNQHLVEKVEKKETEYFQ